jgi:hypothetical protein
MNMNDFCFYVEKNGTEYPLNFVVIFLSDGTKKEVSFFRKGNRNNFYNRQKFLQYCGKEINVNDSGLLVSPNNIFIEPNKKYAIPLVVILGIMGMLFGQVYGCLIGAVIGGIIGLALDADNRAIADAWNKNFIPTDKLE